MTQSHKLFLTIFRKLGVRFLWKFKLVARKKMICKSVWTCGRPHLSSYADLQTHTYSCEEEIHTYLQSKINWAHSWKGLDFFITQQTRGKLLKQNLTWSHFECTPTTSAAHAAQSNITEVYSLSEWDKEMDSLNGSIIIQCVLWRHFWMNCILLNGFQGLSFLVLPFNRHSQANLY